MKPCGHGWAHAVIPCPDCLRVNVAVNRMVHGVAAPLPKEEREPESGKLPEILWIDKRQFRANVLNAWKTEGEGRTAYAPHSQVVFAENLAQRTDQLLGIQLSQAAARIAELEKLVEELKDQLQQARRDAMGEDL